MCAAVSRPVNVLAVAGLALAEVVAAGARRISVGGALTWIAVSAMTETAKAIRDHGDFSSLTASSPFD